MILNKTDCFLKVHYFRFFNVKLGYLQISRHCERRDGIVWSGEAICQRLWADFHHWLFWAVFHRGQIALALPPTRPFLRCFAMTWDKL